MTQLIKQSRSVQFALLVGAFLLLCFLIPKSEGNLLWRLPPLLAWLPGWINDSVEYLLYEWFPIRTYDPEIEDYDTSTLLRETTRSISAALLFFIEFIREIFLGGVKTFVKFVGWDYIQENEWLRWPALPWTVVIGFVIMLGYSLSGVRLAAFVGLATLYISIFGQWEPTMETLSFVLVAAPLSVFFGLAFGVWAYKSRSVEAVLMPMINIAQVMPHFSYIIPVIVLFGVGDHAGTIATVIFATPPMIRLTVLGLRRVSPEVIDAGLMSGCSKLQILFNVMIPTARQDILIGINQVIMQCLAMAVIASIAGAKGLGFNLLIALNGLRIGQALEIGVCIVLIAIVLDRLSLAWANKQVDYFADRSFVERHRFALILAGLLAAGIALAYIGSLVFSGGINYFYIIPHNKGITTQHFWQSGVDWIVTHWYQSLQAFNKGMIVNVLVPLKTAFLSMPVAATFLLAMGAGYIVGGIRSALIVGFFLLFIALTEWWDRALITAYLVTCAVTIAVTVGTIIGTLCAQNPRASRVALLLCDTFQTFPSFIYLIPVIMLFGVTDTSVVLAVVVYTLIPPVRYTIEGLRSVSPPLRDAGAMMGVTRLQSLLKIEFPLAFPHILLGVNQTVMFALSMVIIGALIGTDDIGQLILKALSDKQGIGNGLLLGLCIAFMGLAADQVIATYAKERRALLGLD